MPSSQRVASCMPLSSSTCSIYSRDEMLASSGFTKPIPLEADEGQVSEFIANTHEKYVNMQYKRGKSRKVQDEHEKS